MSDNDFEGLKFETDEDGFDAESTDLTPPVLEVYGTPENIQQYGSPIVRSDDTPIRYYFYPTWRSQILNLVGFFILSLLTVVISRYVPATVVAGDLFTLGGTTYYLHLPFLTLLPGAMLGKILIHIYDAKYIIDERGVEAQIGLVSLELRQPRLRWEDIRGVEPSQTIWERLLGIGTVGIGSAMTQDVEIVMSGVANPRAVQLLVNGERDRRLRELAAGGASVGLRHATVSE